MIITVPTVVDRKKKPNGEIEVVTEKLQLEIDTSFRAHMKWEKYFQETLKCDLNTYYQRVVKWSKNKDLAAANMLGILKLLYCYVNSDKLSTFEDFLKLFDFSIAEEILTQITKVLKEISSTVSKN